MMLFRCLYTHRCSLQVCFSYVKSVFTYYSLSPGKSPAISGKGKLARWKPNNLQLSRRVLYLPQTQTKLSRRICCGSFPRLPPDTLIDSTLTTLYSRSRLYHFTIISTLWPQDILTSVWYHCDLQYNSISPIQLFQTCIAISYTETTNCTERESVQISGHITACDLLAEPRSDFENYSNGHMCVCYRPASSSSSSCPGQYVRP